MVMNIQKNPSNVLFFQVQK